MSSTEHNGSKEKEDIQLLEKDVKVMIIWKFNQANIWTENSIRLRKQLIF